MSARARAAALAAAAAWALAACGAGDATVASSGPTVAVATTAPAATTAGSSLPASAPATTAVAATAAPSGVVVDVQAIDNTFRPERVVVAQGTEVRWVNRGRNEHDVLSVETGGFGVEKAAFGPGDEYSHVFVEPGEYRYYCSLHGTADAGMVGTVVVEEAG